MLTGRRRAGRVHTQRFLCIPTKPYPTPFGRFDTVRDTESAKLKVELRPRSSRCAVEGILISSWWMRRINWMLSRCFDFAVRRMDGRTEGTRGGRFFDLRSHGC